MELFLIILIIISSVDVDMKVFKDLFLVGEENLILDYIVYNFIYIIQEIKSLIV